MEEKEKTLSEKLNAPFTIVGADGKEYPAHKWRVQSFNQSGCYCVPYIDARQVSQRLNEVFGVDGWSNTIEETQGGKYLICTIEAGGSSKSDVGTQSNVEKEKGMASDSLKRAAVHFGIGQYLYNIEMVKLKKKDYKGKDYPCTEKGEILWSGDVLTSYINMLHPLRLKLTEIYNSLNAEGKTLLTNNFKEIWNEMSK